MDTNTTPSKPFCRVGVPLTELSSYHGRRASSWPGQPNQALQPSRVRGWLRTAFYLPLPCPCAAVLCCPSFAAPTVPHFCPSYAAPPVLPILFQAFHATPPVHLLCYYRHCHPQSVPQLAHPVCMLSRSCPDLMKSLRDSSHSASSSAWNFSLSSASMA
eukprot:scaffold276172_cov19-Tisochrysis_lutea.AAC.1